jgi:hypothetical protein
MSTPDGQPLMSFPFEQPALVAPSEYGSRAIVRSLGGAYALLNTSEGTVIPLEFPGADPESVTHDTGLLYDAQGTRFELFGDLGASEAYLVDLASGASVSVAELVDSAGPVISATVSSDDHWLTAMVGLEVYLVDLTAPEAIAPLELNSQMRTGVFAGSGDAIVAIRELSDVRTEIVARDLRSEEVRSLTPPADWSGFRVFAGDVIVAFQETTAWRVFLDDREPELLLESTGTPIPLMVDPASGNLLLQQIGPDDTTWTIAGLEGTEGIDLPELTNRTPIAYTLSARWALFAESLAPAQGGPGTPYLSLDLATGAILPLLEQDAHGIFFAQFPSSDDGRFHLVQATSTAQGRLWLLDGETGTAALVGQSTGNAVGSLTPDGCYLAVGTFDALGEGRAGEVRIIDLASGEVRASSPDVALLGWARA